MTRLIRSWKHLIKIPRGYEEEYLANGYAGKAVEQQPEEGTADELYEQIVAEKTQLIKDGKIKKEKPLPEITEDEIPFEIPSSWKWVRLGELAILQNGDRSSKYPVESDYVENGISFLVQKIWAKNTCLMIMLGTSVKKNLMY